MTDKAPELTTRIVGAFLAKQKVAVADLSELIGLVHRALLGVESGGSVEEPVAVALSPAVPIRRSMTPDYLICLEDGKRFKSIRRHLQASHGMDPAAYRTRWGLKADYPMVASSYSQARSKLAKSIGLGQRGRNLVKAEAAPPPEPEPVKPATKRARRAKAMPSTDA